MRFDVTRKPERISAILAGRVSSIEVGVRHGCRPPPARPSRCTIAMQRRLLMLLLCLSDVAVHGDFRFRREVNETVEPTSIAALRSCGRHAVVPAVVLQTRTSFKNNSAEIYDLRFTYTDLYFIMPSFFQNILYFYNEKYFSTRKMQNYIYIYISLF